ncbi:MAG: TMEM165/GDT1 family protein [Chloroflexi bacterium]|nr:TMEM165/GDT1 family protein [Chloroflexota bacterium]
MLAGSVLTLLPSQPVRLAAGAGFLVFAVLAWRRQEEEEIAEEAEATKAVSRRRPSPWLAAFLVVFAAEWGDLTQLATAALVANTHEPLSVALGAIGGLWTVTIIAATTGAQLGRFLSGNLLNRVSAVLFAVVGLAVIVTTLKPF